MERKNKCYCGKLEKEKVSYNNSKKVKNESSSLKEIN